MDKQTCIRCAHGRRTSSGVIHCKRRDRFMPDLKLKRMPWCEFDSNKPLGLSAKIALQLEQRRNER